MLIAVAGCAHSQGPSPFRVSMPTIVTPLTIACRLDGQPEECSILRRRDFEDIVRQLKGACLALGQSKAECQAE